MIGDVLFILAQLSLCLLGAGAAFHPSVRALSLPARLAVALAGGAVALTIAATVFSTLHVPWSAAALPVPLLLISGILGIRWARRPAFPVDRPTPSAWPVLPTCLATLAFVYLIVSLASSAATSIDYLLFWGVKAARFAEVRGIDAEFLRNGYSYHAVPDYPPLVPVIDAWGALAAGRMPWRLVPVFSAMWAVAAAAIVFDRLRQRLAAGAAAVTAFWSVALSFSLAYSFSGGNAEAPLLFFETAALVSLLTEPKDGAVSRFLPALALCGASLTKVEGSVAAAALIAGTILRDRLLRREGGIRKALPLIAGPALGLLVWFGYQRSAGLAVGFRPHGELLRLYPAHLGSIARNMLSFANAGTLWLSWGVPVCFLIVFARRWKSVLPAAVLAAGILGFLVFDYLHDADDPSIRISWTMPRVSQSALSAVILAAGWATLKSSYRDEPA